MCEWLFIHGASSTIRAKGSLEESPMVRWRLLVLSLFNLGAHRGKLLGEGSLDAKLTFDFEGDLF